MWHGSPAGLDALESGAAVTDLLLLAGGALIGALLALLGAGGSILLLPLLVSGLSLPKRRPCPCPDPFLCRITALMVSAGVSGRCYLFSPSWSNGFEGLVP